MLSPALLLSVVMMQSGGSLQAAPPAPARELVVVVAIPVYSPDGSVRTETTALPVTGAGLIHVFSRRTLCAPAASGATEPGDAAFGWRVASQIVTRSETSVVVSLDWRRMWDAGRKVNNGPGGTVQLTLHPGDRIPLDHIPNALPLPDCRAVGLGLEVKVARTAPAAPSPSTAALPMGATAGGAKPVNAELWLTHTTPAGTEHVSHQIVRMPEAGGRFSFTPTSLATSRGDLSVELAGTIDRFRTPTGAEFFVLSMNRLVSGANLPPSGVSATTGAVVPMPVGDDVLAFELMTAGGRSRGGGGGGGGVRTGGGGGVGGVAAGRITPPDPAQIQARGGGAGGRGAPGGNVAQLAALLEGHQFSLRLRVTPIN